MANLMVMCGIPGSGKSTFANDIFLTFGKNSVVVSSDAVRKKLYGDESIQEDPEAVFREVDREVDEWLAKGVNVIYDATNIKANTRKDIIKKHALADHYFCTYLKTPLDTCLSRNENRERHVPESVIKRMYSTLEVPTEEEGFEKVFIF